MKTRVKKMTRTQQSIARQAAALTNTAPLTEDSVRKVEKTVEKLADQKAVHALIIFCKDADPIFGKYATERLKSLAYRSRFLTMQTVGALTTLGMSRDPTVALPAVSALEHLGLCNVRSIARRSLRMLNGIRLDANSDAVADRAGSAMTFIESHAPITDMQIFSRDLMIYKQRKISEQALEIERMLDAADASQRVKIAA